MVAHNLVIRSRSLYSINFGLKYKALKSFLLIKKISKTNLMCNDKKRENFSPPTQVLQQ